MIGLGAPPRDVQAAIAVDVILSGRPEILVRLRDAFCLRDAPSAASVEGVRHRASCSGESVLIVDAGAPWAEQLLSSLMLDPAPATLIVVEPHVDPGFTDAATMGVDAFITLPGEETLARHGIEAALASRRRHATSLTALAETRRQLLSVATDFREMYEREQQRTRELLQSLSHVEYCYLQTVRALATAVEAKDPFTGRHLERVTVLADALLRATSAELAANPLVSFGFLLHDIGKIGVPDAILMKEGALTVAEMEIMKRHPVIGARIVEGVEFLASVVSIIRHHHERWDGSGYPDGLAGTEIPKAARVFALADAADAMLNPRPYRAPMSLDETVAEIVRGAGTQFDPESVESFLELVRDGALPAPDAYSRLELA